MPRKAAATDNDEMVNETENSVKSPLKIYEVFRVRPEYQGKGEDREITGWKKLSLEPEYETTTDPAHVEILNGSSESSGMRYFEKK